MGEHDDDFPAVQNRRKFWRKHGVDRSMANLPPAVAAYLDERLHERRSLYSHWLQQCESPIEQLLGVELLLYWNNMHSLVRHITPQYKITADKQPYRVDFALWSLPPDGREIKREAKVAVECDGHDFHEKTKEQARRDKERDRKLQIAGWRVLRFTGSEIYQDPDKCVWQIHELLSEATGLSESIDEEIRANRPGSSLGE